MTLAGILALWKFGRLAHWIAQLIGTAQALREHGVGFELHTKQIDTIRSRDASSST